MIELIDSHCHLDTYYRRGDLDRVLNEAAESGVSKIIGVGTSAKDWELCRNLASKYKDNVYYTVGLHPCYVEDDWEEQLQLVVTYFAEDMPPVALGEIGLDLFHLPESPEEQEKVKTARELAFKKQLSFAVQLDCPVIIHSRGAFYRSVELIDESGMDWKKVVFHCFSEGSDEIKALMDRGGRASFTGVITFKKAENVREALKVQGIERLMIETDAPYLAPVPFRGKENYPAYVKYTAERAAEVLGVSFEELAQRTTENTRTFFNI